MAEVFLFGVATSNTSDEVTSCRAGNIRASFKVVSCSQNFRLTAEGLELMAAFIGQGPSMRPFDRHVKQPITARFVQHHVSGRGNVPQ